MLRLDEPNCTRVIASSNSRLWRSHCAGLNGSPILHATSTRDYQECRTDAFIAPSSVTGYFRCRREVSHLLWLPGALLCWSHSIWWPSAMPGGLHRNNEQFCRECSVQFKERVFQSHILYLEFWCSVCSNWYSLRMRVFVDKTTPHQNTLRLRL